MLFHLDFNVKYSAEMSQNDLFTIWAEEAGAALGAKDAGVVVDLWKAVGTRRVLAIVKVENMEMLDQILLDLPIRHFGRPTPGPFAWTEWSLACGWKRCSGACLKPSDKGMI